MNHATFMARLVVYYYNDRRQRQEEVEVEVEANPE